MEMRTRLPYSCSFWIVTDRIPTGNAGVLDKSALYSASSFAQPVGNVVPADRQFQDKPTRRSTRRISEPREEATNFAEACESPYASPISTNYLRLQVTWDKPIGICLMINIYEDIARYMFHTNKESPLLRFSITAQETGPVRASSNSYWGRLILQSTCIRKRWQQDGSTQGKILSSASMIYRSEGGCSGSGKVSCGRR